MSNQRQLDELILEDDADDDDEPDTPSSWFREIGSAAEESESDIESKATQLFRMRLVATAEPTDKAPAIKDIEEGSMHPNRVLGSLCLLPNATSSEDT